MRCEVGSLPTSYLGMPLSITGVFKSLWNPVIERIERKLASWRARYLFIAGRITLIQFALANLPIYFMTLFKCSSSVVNRIEKLQRNFLWQGKVSKKNYHLLNWKSICMPKEEGGLGLRPLREVKKVLLGKWLWRIGDESDSL